MDDNSSLAVYFFIGVYLLMAVDFILNDNAILISMMVLLILGSYFSIRWIIAKRKSEKYKILSPILS